MAVVGAGIVGAACADALSAAGLSVALFESRFPGGGASAASMGHLLVLDDSEAEFALSALSRRLWDGLVPEMPADCQDERRGTLWVAADEAEMAHVPAKAAFYRERGVAAEIFSAEDLASTEPELRPGLAGGLLIPEDRVLYPPAASRWLLARAVARGARVHAGAEVLEIGPGFVRTARGRTPAGTVINAAGCGAPALTPGLPIEPRRGHVVVTDRYPGFCRHQVMELGYLTSAHTANRESVAFNLQPRATGQLLLGSSREFVGFEPSVNRPLVARMVARAAEYVPRLTQLQALRTWVGFRPATPDNLPLVGPWPKTPGVWIAAGHEGLGITACLGTAALVAAGISGAEPPIDPAPYLPARVLAEAAHG